MKNHIRDLLQRKTDSSPFTADDISGKLESIEKKTKINGIAMGGIGIVIILVLFGIFGIYKNNFSSESDKNQNYSINYNPTDIATEQPNNNLSLGTKSKTDYQKQKNDKNIISKVKRIASKDITRTQNTVQDDIDTNAYEVSPDSITLKNSVWNFKNQDVLPLVSISLNELNSIIPGSYENGKFYSYIDYITTKEELNTLRPEFDTSDLSDGEYIVRFKYEHGNNLFDSTRFQSGVPIDSSIRDINNYDRSLYLSYTDYHLFNDDDIPIIIDRYFISPFLEYENILPSLEIEKAEIRLFDLLNNADSTLPYDSIYQEKIYQHGKYLDSLRILVYELKTKLIPVKVTPFRDYYVVLWFYPTKEFISKLPDRYRNDMAEQYELYKQIENKGEGLGEVCIKLDGKTDYFGICGERRGAIEEIRFTSTTANNISADLRLKEDRTLKVYISTIMGQVIHQEKTSLSGGAQLIDVLPTKPLQSGPYFFVIESDKGELAIEKIFINE
jgi:hypothetical protein